MVEENQKNNDLVDHDLLVKLNTQMEGLIEDVKDLKDTTAKRVDNLETEKQDKQEANRIKREEDHVHEQIWSSINWLSAIAYTGIGLVLALQFYFNFLK